MFPPKLRLSFFTFAKHNWAKIISKSEFSFQENFPASIISKRKVFGPSYFVMALEVSYLSYMRLCKNFATILHPRVRNILSHELATNTIWHFRHLIFHIWKENGGIYQKKRNVLFTGLEKCLIFTFCRIKQR